MWMVGFFITLPKEDLERFLVMTREFLRSTPAAQDVHALLYGAGAPEELIDLMARVGLRGVRLGAPNWSTKAPTVH